MKHRQIMNLLYLALPVCVLLRTIQIIFTIDDVTGFVKQQYRDICTLITIVIFAATATMCVLAYFTENVTRKNTTIQPMVAFSCVLTGGMYLCEMFSCLSTLNGVYNILLIFLALISAIVFIAYGIEKIQPYNFPSIMLIVPTIYYVVKLIKLFVSTSTLALVTENIFLLFSNSALLWFMFEFSSYENNFGNEKKSPKTIFACGVTASMLCVVTALPKLLLHFFKFTQISNADICSSVLMLAHVIFVLSYTISNFCPKDPAVKKVTSKHSC